MVATASGPILMSATFLLDKWEDIGVILAASITAFYLTVLAYALSRIGLLVLIFYSFKAMPVDVYKTVEWSEYFPHFS